MDAGARLLPLPAGYEASVSPVCKVGIITLGSSDCAERKLGNWLWCSPWNTIPHLYLHGSFVPVGSACLGQNIRFTVSEQSTDTSLEATILHWQREQDVINLFHFIITKGWQYIKMLFIKKPLTFSFSWKTYLKDSVCHWSNISI